MLFHFQKLDYSTQKITLYAYFVYSYLYLFTLMFVSELKYRVVYTTR